VNAHIEIKATKYTGKERIPLMCHKLEKKSAALILLTLISIISLMK
jgi:hypothetical protein